MTPAAGNRVLRLRNFVGQSGENPQHMGSFATLIVKSERIIVDFASLFDILLRNQRASFPAAPLKLR